MGTHSRRCSTALAPALAFTVALSVIPSAAAQAPFSLNSFATGQTGSFNFRPGIQPFVIQRFPFTTVLSNDESLGFDYASQLDPATIAAFPDLVFDAYVSIGQQPVDAASNYVLGPISTSDPFTPFQAVAEVNGNFSLPEGVWQSSVGGASDFDIFLGRYSLRGVDADKGIQGQVVFLDGLRIDGSSESEGAGEKLLIGDPPKAIGSQLYQLRVESAPAPPAPDGSQRFIYDLYVDAFPSPGSNRVVADFDVGTPEVCELVHDPATGALFAFVSWGDFYTLHRSGDGGTTWVETIRQRGSLRDVSAAVLGDRLFAAIVTDASPRAIRLRSFDTSDGVRTFYSEGLLSQNEAPFTEVELVSNADTDNDTLYVAGLVGNSRVQSWYVTDTSATPEPAANDFQPLPDIFVDVDQAFDDIRLVWAGPDRLDLRVSLAVLNIFGSFFGYSVYDLDDSQQWDSIRFVNPPNTDRPDYTLAATGDSTVVTFGRFTDADNLGQLDYQGSYDAGDTWEFLTYDLAGGRFLKSQSTAAGGYGIGVVSYVEPDEAQVYVRQKLAPDVFSGTVFPLNDVPADVDAAAAITALPLEAPNDQFHYGMLFQTELGLVYETVTGCPGDTNGDRRVNAADLLQILGSFGDELSNAYDGDVNLSGAVDGTDLVLVLARFGTECPIDRR